MDPSIPEAIVSRHGWSRGEYERAVAAGAFGAEPRIELIDGEVVERTPQGSRHFTGVRLVEEALRQAFGVGFDVRSQGPLAIADDSEPEPDVAVVEGSIRDYRDVHPTAALLVVEVSDDSLRRDRTTKQRLYAKCGIPEYWVVALPASRLEVYRDPDAGGYGTVTVHQRGDGVAPLACPNATIAIDDLLP